MSDPVKVLSGAIGALLMLVSLSPVFADEGVRVRKADLDGDGVKEATVYTLNGKITMTLVDKNQDGKPDATIYYRNGFRDHASVDADFDGKTDMWIQYYFTGLPQMISADTDGDGLVDRWIYFKNGFIYRKEWDRNHDGKADCRILFETGGDLRPRVTGDKQVIEKFYDDDFDGVFEIHRRVKRRMPLRRVGLTPGEVRSITS